jgi:trigger factor
VEQGASQPREEYRNSQIAFTVDRKPACIVEFHLHAEPPLVRVAYDKATKSVTKEISLPGFRKGRAPREMVVKKFSNEIDREWQKEIANEAFLESQKLLAVALADRESKVTYTMVSHSIEKGAELRLSFETEPTVPSIDPKQLQLKSTPRPPITETQIDETIRQIRFFFTQWEPIVDRPAQEGDFVILNVDVIETDPPSSLFSETRFEVTDKSMAKWMRSLVIGLSTGESREGISEPDEELSPEAKQEYPPKKVRLTLKKIETTTLPPVDETLLKWLGVSTEEELRTSLSHLLNKKMDNAVQDQERKQVVAFLLDRHPFDLPHTFTVKEARFRMQQLLSHEAAQEEWKGMSESEQQAFLKTVFGQSEKAVRLFYLCKKIVQEANIPLNPADLPKPPTTPLEILVQPTSDAHLHPAEDLREAEAYSKLILEKAEDYIITHALRAEE